MDNKGIILKKISKIYPGTQALKDVDFKLSPGEIHCIVGENGSGKSTFIKILSGVETPEPGAEIWLDGVQSVHHSSSAAIAAGIQVIYQDMSLFPNLTVAENIAFLNEHHKRGLIRWKKIAEVAQSAMAEIGFEIDMNRRVETLSVAQQQLVEIARAMMRPLKLLILDEPTASLTQKEVNALFRVILKLKAKGIAILFISHKMNEIFQIAEKITIFRDGVNMGSYAPASLTQDTLVYLMSGQNQTLNRPAPITHKEEIILEVRDLSRRANYKNISFTLRKGEILGITGLLGSGRTELALSLFGMNPPDTGEIFLKGKRVTYRSNIEARADGICYVSEDRRNLGLILDQSIQDNLTITILNAFLNKGLLDKKKERAAASELVEKLGIKTGAIDAPAESLSGGNQQKLVLSKWLSLTPDVLILDQPTIGIDVIAKQNIHTLVKSLAEKGMSIILISDEIAEVMRNSHRALVMRRGKIVHEFYPEKENEERLLREFNLA